MDTLDNMAVRYIEERLLDPDRLEKLLGSVDWNAMARDAEMGGDMFTIETAHGEVHVFSNR